MTYLIIYTLLISLCLAGLSGMLFFRDYVYKISCLSISYSSFLIIITLLALKSSLVNEVLIIMVSILMIFAVNLLIGIGIARNITEAGGEVKK